MHIELKNGTKKCVIQNQLTFKDYVNVLFNKVPMIKSQFGFRSRNHEIYTEKINKIALMIIKQYRIIMELIHILMVILIITIKK